MIKAHIGTEITRGYLINLIANNNDEWIMVLKALLIKNPSYAISKRYVLEKLNFMKRNPSEPYRFLDYEGLAIYTVLRQT